MTTLEVEKINPSDHRPVIAVPKTSNMKTGPVAITYTSQHSCPQDCPFKGSGCYAEYGPIGRITRRLNANPEADPAQIARLEAALIDGLPADRDLRLHGVGDCRTRQAARIVSAAARRYLRRFDAVAALGYARRPDCSVWTYTHAWRDIPVASWSGVSVLASVETPAAAAEAYAAGYAPAIVVPEHTSERAFQYGEVKAVPCPNQTRGVTCEECRLCLDAPALHRTRRAIAFAAHGSSKNTRVRVTLALLNG